MEVELHEANNGVVQPEETQVLDPIPPIQRSLRSVLSGSYGQLSRKRELPVETLIQGKPNSVKTYY